MPIASGNCFNISILRTFTYGREWIQWKQVIDLFMVTDVEIMKQSDLFMVREENGS